MEEYYKIVAFILAGLLGVCVGSFLNVVIYRVPLGMSLAKPDSHCPNCKYELKWFDNVPVLSYLFLGGKCRNCKQPISFRYPAVELFNMLAWLGSVWLFWDVSIVFTVITALASTLLICVFFIDLDHMLIFDRFNVMLLILGVLAVFFDPYYDWLSHLIGGVAGFAVFYGLHALFYYGFKKEALGGGDIKLAGAVGLLLGWERLLFGVCIASLAASVILLLLKRKNATTDTEAGETGEEAEAGTEIATAQEATEEATEGTAENEALPGEYPFAPFLCSGFWIAMMFGASIIAWYLSLFGI